VSDSVRIILVILCVLALFYLVVALTRGIAG
jgi:hypothetical protein